MNKTNTIENSVFYRTNLKIQSNLWKAYTITLLASFMVIGIKGLA